MVDLSFTLFAVVGRTLAVVNVVVTAVTYVKYRDDAEFKAAASKQQFIKAHPEDRLSALHQLTWKEIWATFRAGCAIVGTI